MKEHFYFFLLFQHGHRWEICFTFSFGDKQLFCSFQRNLISKLDFGKMPQSGELKLEVIKEYLILTKIRRDRMYISAEQLIYLNVTTTQRVFGKLDKDLTPLPRRHTQKPISKLLTKMCKRLNSLFFLLSTVCFCFILYFASRFFSSSFKILQTAVLDIFVCSDRCLIDLYAFMGSLLMTVQSMSPLVKNY